MTYRYKFNPKKLNRKAHLIDGSEITLCKAENGHARFGETSDTLPEGRVVCGVCELYARQARARQQPKRQADRSRKDFYTSWEWAELRYKALKHYGALCMCCGSASQIVVDHIKPRSKYPELELEFSNLQVLCQLCNRGKGKWDETDFRVDQLDRLPEGALEHMADISRH